VLKKQRRVGFRNQVTDDESWFLQDSNHQQSWCVSADEVPTRVVHTIAAQKTILTVFLRINGAISIKRLRPEGKFNSGCFCEKYSSRFPRSCTAGALHVSQRRYCILTMPHVICQLQLKSGLKVANSDMLPNLRAAMLSVHVTSVYSVIRRRSSKFKSSRQWKTSKGYLVRSLRT
jgi:hypothetical protein